MELNGKLVLVTGAARGIGAECAYEMARHGAVVVCVDIIGSDATVRRILEVGGKAFGVACDISDEARVLALFSAIAADYGRLDHLTHCAGIVRESSLLATSAEDFDYVIRVNLRGSFLVGREALRQMTAGSATFIASDLAYIGRADHSAYVASKHGVLGLVRSWAHEFAPRLRVNAICPGPTNTEMVSPENLSDKSRMKELELPMGRFAEPREIAEVAVFLASERASFITGQGIGVNGGSVMT